MNRDELYRQVWSHPMTHVARELGKSDVSIAKLCKKLDVPVPPRGYWAKLQAGKEVAQTPLPPTAEHSFDAPKPSSQRQPQRRPAPPAVAETVATIEIQLEAGTAHLNVTIRRA